MRKDPNIFSAKYLMSSVFLSGCPYKSGKKFQLHGHVDNAHQNYIKKTIAVA